MLDRAFVDVVMDDQTSSVFLALFVEQLLQMLVAHVECEPDRVLWVIGIGGHVRLDPRRRRRRR